jgi:putative ABC transport system permease protein
LRSLPGVESVSMAHPYPFRPAGARPVTPERGTDTTLARAVVWVADAGYLSTIGARLSSGRDFTAADDAAAPPVIIISESLAQVLWPGENPLGRRIKLGEADSEDDWRTVVGVSRDIRKTLTAEHHPDLFVPYAQSPARSMFFMLRATAGGVPAGIQPALARVDPDLPAQDVEEMAAVVALQGADRRLVSRVLAGFSAFTVLLSALGLYAALAYTVSQRRREIAVRMALGAERGTVTRMVVAQGGRLVLAGIAADIVLGALGTRALGTQVVGVTPGDPATWIGTVAVLGGAALLALVQPAVRAAKLDPARVLRED